MNQLFKIFRKNRGSRTRTKSTTTGYHIYELTNSIPRNYAGMTTAMLYRCWQFGHFGLGDSLTILTLQTGLNVKRAERHIQARWHIPNEVRIRNIWHDLRHASDEELLEFDGIDVGATEHADQRKKYIALWPFYRELKNNKGIVLKTEHFRINGSLVLQVGLENNRHAVLMYNSIGTPIRYWQNIEDFYLAWLDLVITQRPAVLINEHRNISKFLYRANMQGVKTCQVVHGSHQKGRKSPFSEFNSRARMMHNLTGFDLVSVLTAWQKEDFLALGMEPDNLCIMPNATQPVEDRSPPIRRATSGTVIGRMSKGKQISHAVQAVSQLDDDANVILDIYGDGEERQQLAALVNDLPSKSRIIFKGHVPGAARYLSTYSFLLFTSKAEGQGLVVLEAMAHGCIPICYNMRYGPRSMITDGINGLLVPPDDIDALADAIRTFIGFTEEKRQAMRQAAIQRAQYFYPENNMRRWRVALDELMAQPPRRQVAYEKCTAVADSVEISANSCRIKGRLEGTERDISMPSKLIISTRKKASFIKVHADLHRITSTSALFTASFSLSHLPLRKEDFLDLYMQPIGALWNDKIRISHGLDQNSAIVAGLKIYKTKHGNLSLDAR